LRPVDHANRIQRIVVHRIDHGRRHRGEERYPPPGRESKISRRRHAGRRSDDSGRPPPSPSNRDDGDGGRRGHVAAGACHWRRIANAAAARDRGYRRYSDIDGVVADHHSCHTIPSPPRIMTMRRSFLKLSIGIAFVLSVSAVSSLRTAEPLPGRLSDDGFWRMITGFSEEGGYFRFENFLSNELAFQQVIPVLKDTT